MRYSFTVAAFAIGAMAIPQESYSTVQPITQISDGQIQAPPATSYPEVPVSSASVPEVPEVPTLTSVDTVVIPTGAPTVVPSGNGTTPSSNGTVSTGSPTGSPTGPGAPENTGAAATNMASFGALILAVAGFVLA